MKLFTQEDVMHMQASLKLAEHAAQQGEVPVGAVLVVDGEIIASGNNCSIAQHDPTAHAEIIALRRGAAKIGNYRLTQTTLYVTLEPCIMCAGALIHARIKRLVYGALDSRAGAIKSKANLLDANFLNHRISHAGGLLQEPSSELLRSFFKARRLSPFIKMESYRKS